MQQQEVQSPCVSICTMDEATGLCMGCYRTLEEIQQWWDLDAAGKQTIVDKADRRQAQLFD